MPVPIGCTPAAAHLRPISIPTTNKAHARAHAHAAANRTRPEHSYWQHSSTFPPFAPSRIAWLNQAILAIPPFPCANPAQHARPRREMPTLTRACRRMRRVHSLAHSLIFQLKALAIELDVLSSSDFTHCLLRADPS